MTLEHNKLIERVATRMETGGRATCTLMIDRLEELLAAARRGIELRERYSPKTGRKFLIQRRAQ